MSKNSKLYYTAGELADLFELPKQTLLYYDKMGILSPEFISENNYRHYSLKQYLILEVILNMRKLGIPISKIKEYLEERSIDSLQALLQAKDRECEEIIAHNEKIRKNIHVVFQQLDKIRESRLDQITVTFRRAKRFLLSPVPPECSGDESIGCGYRCRWLGRGADYPVDLFDRYGFRLLLWAVFQLRSCRNGHQCDAGGIHPKR